MIRAFLLKNCTYIRSANWGVSSIETEIIPIEPARVMPGRDRTPTLVSLLFMRRLAPNYNRMKTTLLSILAFLFLSITAAHSQHTVSGTVKNAEGEILAGANVYLVQSMVGTSTDGLGTFDLRLKSGQHIIRVAYLGYEAQTDTLDVQSNLVLEFVLQPSALMVPQLVVEATRANAETPMTTEEFSKEQLEKNNLGQDLPILLNQGVSVVTTSDAGAGIGYTGMRIRGSDATRINVTVNGVPLNDAESHGVFWVNMPDFTSSTNSIQIQRGVGTSSNGSAAFGASINMETTSLDTNAGVTLSNSIGSFNTRKHNIQFNSGLLNNHFNFEGRLSSITSDGYIDRSAADLKSYYLAGGYYGEKLMVKAVTFAGHEVTQQAWWGTPASRLNGDEDSMLEHALYNGYSEAQTQNLLNSGRTYNHYLYDNEVDDYRQSHYQLITGYQINKSLYLNVTGHYTRGLGFFEQYKDGEDFADVGLNEPVIGNDTIGSTDMIFRRWLDNHFYGGVYSLEYKKRNLNLTLGGSYNEYQGGHYGEIIWAAIANEFDIRHRYYNNDGFKSDLSNYLRAEWAVGDWTLYGDLQYRHIEYRANGIDNDQQDINVATSFDFINPKAGVHYRLNERNAFYLSVARGSREPVRNDFIDAPAGATPQPEYLTNAEMGWGHRAARWTANVNAYLMYYQNQLVLTGELNDVGSPIRTNVPESYRAGIEFSGEWRPWGGMFWRPNATLSQNKITQFEEVLYDYTNGFDVIVNEYQNTDISFSPSVIAGSELGYRWDFGLEMALLTKYVGRQYLDNTSNVNRSIDPYLVNDVRLSMDVNTKWTKALRATLLVNNVLNEMYSANGYTYSYIYGDMITENFYYPQAGTNWLLGLTLGF